MSVDSERDPLSSRLGVEMGGYRIERLLGSGGMAAVYLGVRGDGQRRAIKVLHPQIARDRNLRARFAQEVEAVSRLSHPAIVRIDDMGAAADGSPFMVMEVLDGKTLHDHMGGGTLSVPEALQLLDTLLAALAVAHAGGIVHRDIKPDNLFLDQTGLRVLDFGIARVRRDSVAHIQTKTGTALGTPSYMAQEQIKGVDVDHRADLFAAGAVLLKMTTGRRVHEEPDPQRRTLMMLTTPAPPTLMVAPQLPAGIAQIIDRALAFAPTERYPDAATMQEDVRAVAAGAPPPYASSAPPISTHAGATVPPNVAPPTVHRTEPTAATRVGPPTPPAQSPGHAHQAQPAHAAQPHAAHQHAAPQHAAPVAATPLVAASPKSGISPLLIIGVVLGSVVFGVLIVLVLM